MLEVCISDEQERLVLELSLLEELVRRVVSSECVEAEVVYLNFIDEKAIMALHEEYYGDPSPTDCLSFPLDGSEDPPPRVLGELFVSTDAACDHASSEGGSPYDELTLYVVHSLLHLMGYADDTEEHIAEMRSAEVRHLLCLQREGLMLRPPVDVS